ncbi:MAG: ABC transporter ATP-binding protein [Candidatus Aenigmatarchaeota archaeon]
MVKQKTNGFVLETRNVQMVYNPDLEAKTVALAGIDMGIKQGEFVAIMGPSGSGKTTLLDVIGCLLKPTTGEVFVDGVRINDLDDDDLTYIRGEKIGFVFQQYNLIPSSTAEENVALPLRIMGKSKGVARDRARELLKSIGIGHRYHHKPSELSGGEQQRVAIARALANDPKIILGDEPTGNLDTKTGRNVLNILKDLNKKKGYTIVVVTHDPKIKTFADRIIHIKDGLIDKRKE